MSPAEFDSLVRRLEPRVRAAPKAYRRRVLALAVAGYAYMGVVLGAALLLLLVALLVAIKSPLAGIKAAIVLMPFAWLILRAAWVKLAPPEGWLLDRAEAPALFALVDDLSCQLGAPRVHDIRVSGDFNAALAQTPRLGLFGWHRNTLLLGLPLLKALTPSQLAAVVAHELGHLAGGHARLGNWIYRSRTAWSRLASGLDGQPTTGGLLFRPFFRRFVPWFAAYSFPLARQNEFEADAASARVSGAAAAAQALTAVNVVGRFLAARFWPDVLRQADVQPEPGRTLPFAALDGALGAPLPPDDRRDWLAEVMTRQTTADDTHPSLAERLGALGRPPELALPAPGQAADRLIEPATRARLTAACDAQWQAGIGAAWRARHAEAGEQRQRLAELDARADDPGATPLSLAERLQRAQLTEAVGAGAAAALAQFRAAHALAPDDPVTGYLLGTRLLARNDPDGVRLMRAAMAAEPSALAAGHLALAAFHERQGDGEAARAGRLAAEERLALERRAEQERATVEGSDRFAPHGLEAGDLAAIRAQVATVKGLREAWLVRKQVRYLPEQPLLLLVFSVTAWWAPVRTKRVLAAQQALVEALRLPLPGRIVSVELGSRRAMKRARGVPGARLLPAPR